MTDLRSTTGARLNIRLWPRENAKAQVFIVHGYAEHIDRYNHLAEKLNNKGYSVIGYDQSGHGSSEGERAYASRFDQYVWDLHKVINKYKKTKLPQFLFGHSMGGLVVTSYCILYRPQFNGVITSGAALMVNKETSPILQKIAPILGEIFPKMKTTKIGSQDISRNQDIVKEYDSDPLVYREGMKARLAAEILGRIKKTNKLAHLFTQPVLMTHGGADQLTDPQGTVGFYNNCSSTDKELKIWDGLYHELINEPERKEVIKYMINWMDQRI